MKETKSSIKLILNSLFNEIKADPYQDGRAWEHCYKYFQENVKHKNAKDIDIDRASLHLSAFLASFGMYRTKLTEKDYKIFGSLVKIVIKKEYEKLWDINFEKTTDDYSEIIRAILELKEEIDKYFKEDICIGKTPTRTSKILLGSMACTPGYDQNLRTGLRKKGMCQTLNEKSLGEIIQFYKGNIVEFNNVKYNEQGPGDTRLSVIPYPPMRLIDMYFWKLGVPNND